MPLPLRAGRVVLREAVESSTPYNRQSTFLNDEVCNRLNPFTTFQIRENEWPLPAHSERVRFHYSKICPYQRSQVNLVNNKKIGARNPRTALTRDLLTFSNVDHVDRRGRQFGTESSRQIVPARFYKAQLRMREFLVHLFDGREVHRSIFTNCSVRTTSGFYSHNAFRRQCFRSCENELVLFRINVIGNHVNVVRLAEALAERFNERRFAGPDRAADTDTQRMGLGIGTRSISHDRNNLVYWVS